MSRVIRPLVVVSSLTALLLLSRPPEPPTGKSGAPLLPPARLFQAVAAPYLHLVADYYWLGLLNQVGGAKTAEEARHIALYAELASDLDPRFASVYSFGGLTIPFSAGREKWMNTGESTRLLRKGAAALPDNYWIRFLLAYNLIFYEQRPREAAEMLLALAKHPEAPAYLPALATRLFAASGDIDTGLTVTASLLETAEDGETRAFFEHRMQQLEQERLLRTIDAAVEHFRAREGRLPTALEELVARGDLPRLPEDPLGGTLSLDPQGRAVSSASPKRLVVHDMLAPNQP